MNAYNNITRSLYLVIHWMDSLIYNGFNFKKKTKNLITFPNQDEQIMLPFKEGNQVNVEDCDKVNVEVCIILTHAVKIMGPPPH